MSLQEGSRVGAYEVLGSLGAGGMGEVYRARDTRLGRDVALKILPDAFASDPERLARFEREARTLASLNHPHIAHIYGIEDAVDKNGSRALVMELVEGEDLSQRLTRGPVPIDEAWPIAKQIADALEAAHEQGIVHRDLKPANVKVRDDGTVKVLDFGLAKALSHDAGSQSSAPPVDSPTITSPAMTMRGVILGTAAYMAPEQAKGRVVDKRADIWAFGCLLYELLTGRRAFPGDDVSETMAAVIKSEPDWAGVPAAFRRLLESCLEKDPRRRLRDIGDAWRLLEPAPGSAGAVGVAPSRTRFLPWAIATVGLVAAAAIATLHFSETPIRPGPLSFQISPPDQVAFDIYLALSPDGQRLAFTARDASGVVALWVRDLRTLEAHRLAGTDGAWSPFWSPDGRFLGFAIERQLKRIELGGGPPQTLCETTHIAGTGSWNHDGTIVFGTRGGGGPIYRVAATGGVPEPVTVVDPGRGETAHALPVFLPDGRHFLYLRITSKTEFAGIYVGSLETPPERQRTDRLIATRLAAGYVPSPAGGGRVLFVRDQTLVAQDFDASRLTLTGSPVVITEQIGIAGSTGFFSAAASGGVLAYRLGGDAGSLGLLQLSAFDRSGKLLNAFGDRAVFRGPPALSPDGRRLAVAIGTDTLGPTDLWLIDLARGVNTRFTYGAGTEADPVWSPDGQRVVFRSNRGGSGDLFEKDANGLDDERPLLETKESKSPSGWSPDGRFILFGRLDLKTRTDIWVLPLDGDRQPAPIVRTEFDERHARFSPDGRWIVYVSDESGRDEIYVRTFGPASAATPVGKWRISRDGGVFPRWRRDGREILYRGLTGAVMAVDVAAAGATFEAGIPQVLFDPRALAAARPVWDVTPDGQRFLLGMSATQAAGTPAPITVVVNWQTSLDK